MGRVVELEAACTSEGLGPMTRVGPPLMRNIVDQDIEDAPLAINGEPGGL